MLVSSTSLLAMFASSALAQTVPDIAIPPDRQLVDSNNVNMASGLPFIADKSVSIGGNGGGLSFSRYTSGGGWSDATRYALYRDTSSSTYLRLLVGRKSYYFDNVNGAWVNREGAGITLVQNPYSGPPVNLVTYTATLADGTVIQLTNQPFNLGADRFYYYSSFTVAVASTLTKPSGEKLTFAYAQATTVSSGRAAIAKSQLRLQGMSSSSGYAEKFTYVSNTISNDWFNISNVKLINLGSEYCDITANSCSLSLSWPSLSYSTSASGTNTVTTTSDSLGRVSQYTFNSGGYLIGIRRPSSASDDIAYTYDANGRVSTVINDGKLWNYTFTLSGSSMTAVVNTDATQRIVVSDTTVGLPTSVKDELSRTTIYSYDGNGRLQVATQPEGNQAKYSYDTRGNLTQQRFISKTPGTPADIVTTATFLGSCTSAVTCNEPVATTDANGNETDYTYDPNHGGILTVTAPAATAGGIRPQVRYGYTQYQAYFKNSSGAIVASGSPTYRLTSTSSCQSQASCTGTAGEVRTAIGYGAQAAGIPNNLLPISTSVGAGDGSVSAANAVVYDAIGNVASVDGPLPGSADTTNYFYDAARQLTEAVGPDPDGAGPLKNRAVQMAYTPDGLVSQQSTGTANADGSGFSALAVTSTTYDASDRPIAQRIQDGGGTIYRLTQTGYDVKGRVTCVAVRMDPSQWLSQTDACTPQTTGASGPDRVTRYGYDYGSQLLKTTSGYGTADASDDATLTYSNNGKPLTATDANGNVTSYAYDGFDRPLTTTYAGGSYEQFGVDANGNLLSRRLRDGTSIGYAYDGLNRVTTKTLPSAELAVSFQYDLLGHMTAATRADGNNVSAAYDALGRQTSVTTAIGGTVGSQYDAAGRRARLTWSDGFFVTYGYDNVGEMTAVNESGATALASFSYDNLGRRSALTRANGVTTSYGYDGASNLTSLGLVYPNSVNNLALGFGFNPAGQIASVTRSNDSYAWTGAVDVDRAYTTNALNQYTSAGGTAFGYDGRGNLTSSGSATYGYSSENMMVSAPGASLAYDPLGRLLQTVGSGSTRYGYDGSNLIAEYNSSNALQKRYVFGPGADEVLVEYDASGNKTWLVADERRSVVARVDASGTPTAINRYDEFGIPQGTNVGRHQYTGQAWLPEVGMYYYKARIYSPTLGRFMQTDPIGYANGMNWHNYAHSDPINGSDPTGKVCVWDDGSFDTGDSDYMGSGGASNCSGDGGNWVDQGFFDQNGISGQGSLTPIGDGQGGVQGFSYGNSTVTPDVVVTASTDPAWDALRVILGDLGTIISGNGAASVACKVANVAFSGGRGTLQLGVAGTGALGPGAGTGGAGLAIDRYGNVGLYGFAGYGRGGGGYIGGGLSGQISNANGIQNLSGPFTNVSVNGGLGGSASVDAFTGPSSDGVVTGGGFTLGGGDGVGYFSGATNTGVMSLFNAKSALGC